MEPGLSGVVGLCGVCDPVRPVEVVAVVAHDGAPAPERGRAPDVVEVRGDAALDAGPATEVVGASGEGQTRAQSNRMVSDLRSFFLPVHRVYVRPRE